MITWVHAAAARVEEWIRKNLGYCEEWSSGGEIEREILAAVASDALGKVLIDRSPEPAPDVPCNCAAAGADAHFEGCPNAKPAPAPSLPATEGEQAAAVLERVIDIATRAQNRMPDEMNAELRLIVAVANPWLAALRSKGGRNG